MALSEDKKINILLAGNPNSGKTSLFNALTGSRQRVGNYPGVTVEKREGVWKDGGLEITVRDLPGTYSLTTFSPEEKVARDELESGNYNAVVVVVDSTVLERSLMFLLQVMRFEKNIILCLNMADEARAAGQEIDKAELENLLGIKVLETQANQGIGVQELKNAITDPVYKRKPMSPVIESVLGESYKTGPLNTNIIADAANLIIRSVIVSEAQSDHRKITNKVDAVIAHRIFGLPIFLAIMYLLFWLTFTLGEAPMGWIESGIALLGDVVVKHWPGNPESQLLSLIVDGIFAGVGGVLVFLPNIVLLFFGLSIMEDTGYLARAAYVMDKTLNKFGLHGKSFLPLVTGFGCTIPGIMATRTIENERDRLATIFVLPLMSCGARLPIWLMLIPALFAPKWQAPMMWSVYIFGVLLALLLSMLLKKTVLKGDPTPFMLELPPYRLPSPKSVLLRMYDRSKLYLQKAGTVILSISVVLWILSTYPRPESYQVDIAQMSNGQYTEQQADNIRISEQVQFSAVGRIGKALEPVFKPLGFDWRLVTASLGAFAAKEVFVSQMNIVYALGSEDDSVGLATKLRNDYSPLVGVSLIIFLLIGSPCMATVVVTSRETRSWKWALFQFGGLTTLAYLLSMIVYNVGRLVI